MKYTNVKVFNGDEIISKFVQSYGEAYKKAGVSLRELIYTHIRNVLGVADLVDLNGKSWEFVVVLDRPLQPEKNDIIVDSREVDEELTATLDWQTDLSIYLYVNEYANDFESVIFKFFDENVNLDAGCEVDLDLDWDADCEFDCEVDLDLDWDADWDA